MLTITEKELDKQWCKSKEILRSAANNLVSSLEFGGQIPEDYKEAFFYSWVIANWEQGKFNSIRYNNFTTAEAVQVVYQRINQINY